MLDGYSMMGERPCDRRLLANLRKGSPAISESQDSMIRGEETPPREQRSSVTRTVSHDGFLGILAHCHAVLGWEWWVRFADARL